MRADFPDAELCLEDSGIIGPFNRSSALLTFFYGSYYTSHTKGIFDEDQ